MNSAFKQNWYLLAVAVLFFASAAFGQSTTLVLTGVNGASAGGVYTDPYYGTITVTNGASSTTTPVTVLCDDYADESNLGPPSWAVAVTTVANVSTTSNTLKWSGANGLSTQQLYDAIAYLSGKLLAAAPGEAQEAYSFAIWELTYEYGTANIMNPNGTKPFSTISGTTPGTVLYDATQDLNDVLGKIGSLSASQFANVTIYTPIPGSVDPQEFIKVPEASTLAMLGVDLLGLLALAFFFRRQGMQLAS